MTICIRNERGHTEAWESVSPTQRDTLKNGSPYPQVKGPDSSVGGYPLVNGPQWSVRVHIPYSKGHNKALDSAYPT